MSTQNAKQNPVQGNAKVALERTNTLRLAPTIRPLYPVRYAYANFFGEDISKPADPPPLKDLLHKTKASEGQGYMARILRPGWIYIKEEDGEGYFHIFRYEQIEQDGTLVERFPKYLFSNRKNAQGGIYEDRSGGHQGGYPFAFVRKDVTDISISYSEHEWHPDVIDKLNSDPDVRARAMQRVSLVSEDSATVKAEPDNLRALVEDYRDHKDRVLKMRGEEATSSEQASTQEQTTTTANKSTSTQEQTTTTANKSTSTGSDGVVASKPEQQPATGAGEASNSNSGSSTGVEGQSNNTSGKEQPGNQDSSPSTGADNNSNNSNGTGQQQPGNSGSTSSKDQPGDTSSNNNGQPNSGSGEPILEDIPLDTLTTSNSHDMDADSLAVEMRNRAKHLEGDKDPRIVCLFDPVGRQKDIAEVHAKLVLWEKEFSSSIMYPFTIGQIVQQLKESDDEKIQDILKDSINWQEHQQFWSEMDEDIKLFGEYQKRLVELYAAYMHQDGFTNKVGSLDNYFRCFFCKAPKNSEELNQEVSKLCEVSTGLFDGILSSAYGNAAMEKVVAGIEKENNAMGALLVEGFIKMVTTAQFHIDWAQPSARFFDKAILRGLFPLIGKLMAISEYGAKLGYQNTHKGLAKSAHFFAKTFMPWAFTLYGVVIEPGKPAKLTRRELAKTLKKHLEENVKSFPKTGVDEALKHAQGKADRASKLFDWGDKVEIRQIEFANSIETPVHNPGRFSYVFPPSVAHALGALADAGFSGISATMNIKGLYGMLMQTKMDRADPLEYYNELAGVAEAASYTFSLIADSMAVTRAAVGVSAKAATILSRRQSMSIARALAPRLTEKSIYLGKILSVKLVSGLIAVANVAAAADAFYNAYKSFKRGNTGAMVGHILVGAGSVGLFGLATYAFFAGASTGVGVLIGTIAALVLIVAGTLTVLFFNESPFETLLKNCFWGRGRQYALWEHEDERPTLGRRMKQAKLINESLDISNAFQKEYQEFMNYFYQPSLEVKTDKSFFDISGEDERTYYYKFTLPAFEPGVSDIHFSVHVPHYTKRGLRGTVHSQHLTDIFKQLASRAHITEKEGYTEVELSIVTTQDIVLHWYYQPQPNIIAPRRYLSEDGLSPVPIMGMKNEKSV